MTRASNCAPSSETIWPAITEGMPVRGQVDLAAGHRQPTARDRRAAEADAQPAARAAAELSARSTTAPPVTLVWVIVPATGRRERPRRAVARCDAGTCRTAMPRPATAGARAASPACRNDAPSPCWSGPSTVNTTSADRRHGRARSPGRASPGACGRRARSARTPRPAPPRCTRAVSASIHQPSCRCRCPARGGPRPASWRTRANGSRATRGSPGAAARRLVTTSASSRSNDTAPSPSQNGRYVRRRTGSPRPAARSARSCRARSSATCSTRNTITSSETSRCSASIVNRGHLGPRRSARDRARRARRSRSAAAARPRRCRESDTSRRSSSRGCRPRPGSSVQPGLIDATASTSHCVL